MNAKEEFYKVLIKFFWLLIYLFFPVGLSYCYEMATHQVINQIIIVWCYLLPALFFIGYWLFSYLG